MIATIVIGIALFWLNVIFFLWNFLVFRRLKEKDKLLERLVYMENFQLMYGVLIKPDENRPGRYLTDFESWRFS